MNANILFKIRDIILVIAWCLAVYVCMYDWSEIDDDERDKISGEGTEKFA